MSPKIKNMKAAVTIRSKIPIPKKKLSNMHSYMREDIVSSTPARKNDPKKIGHSSPILASKNVDVIRWSVSPIKKIKLNNNEIPASTSLKLPDVTRSETNTSTSKCSMVVCSSDEDVIFDKKSPKKKILNSKVSKKLPVEVISTKEANSTYIIDNISNRSNECQSDDTKSSESYLIKNTKRKFIEVVPNKLNTIKKSAKISINKSKNRDNIVQIKRTKQNKNLAITSKIDSSKGLREQVQNAEIVTKSNLMRSRERSLTNKTKDYKNKITKSSSLTKTANQRKINENKNNQPEINKDVIPKIASSFKNESLPNEEQTKMKPKHTIDKRLVKNTVTQKTKKTPKKKSRIGRIQKEEQIENKAKKTNRRKSNNKDIDFSLEKLINIDNKPNDSDESFKNVKAKIDLEIENDYLGAVRRSSRTRYHVKQYWISNSVLRAQ